MTSAQLLSIIVIILVVEYLIDLVLHLLNWNHFCKERPELVKEIISTEDYDKARRYYKANFKFTLITDGFSLTITLLFIILGGFAWIDGWVQSLSTNLIVQGVAFFLVLQLANALIGLPFSFFKTFVIENNFGFNKSTKTLFLADTLKGLILGAILGASLLALSIYLIQALGANFWVYLWLITSAFVLVLNLFYTRWIVPLFNKQSPLEEGELKSAIATYAQKVGFKLNKILVIDGSKRSSKANAYFSGFGRTKQVTLFDTLINDLTDNEIVGVLAHEVGHYQKNHIHYNLIASVLMMGFTMFLLSLFVNEPTLSLALKADRTSIHMGLIGFFLLYSPISTLTGMAMNYMSRSFEYQADAFAKNTYGAPPLMSALKKLSTHSLSNPNPHPWYVFFNYSHPPLGKRLAALRQ